jgi:hypothetical protein
MKFDTFWDMAPLSQYMTKVSAASIISIFRILPRHKLYHFFHARLTYSLRFSQSGQTDSCMVPYKHTTHPLLSLPLHCSLLTSHFLRPDATRSWSSSRRSIFRKSCRRYMKYALCYQPEGRGFETRWGEWFLSSYLILPASLGPGVYSASNRNECQKHKNNVSGE